MGTTTQGKEEWQMGSVVWKYGVPQKVLGKRGMKKKSVKFKLRSAKRGRVKECAMNLTSAKCILVCGRLQECLRGCTV
jgi:hypothetical protein